MTLAAASTTARIGWELHGIRAALSSPSPELATYIRGHLGASASEAPGNPDLLIDLDWQWGAGGGTTSAASVAAPGAQRVGRHLEERDSRLRWARVPGFDGLRMEAGREGSTVSVAASCRYVPRDALARLRYMKTARREKKTYRTFFKLLYYALYFPMAWKMEISRGWELLHASAVEKEGRGLILAGHGGAGKSTLALSLMADPSFRLVSDNLIFHDGERIYALPEPVRLDGSSLEAIRRQGYQPRPTELPRTAHPKRTFQVEPGRAAPEASAEAVVVLRFTGESFLRPLEGPQVVAHLVGSRDLVKEVEGYRAVAAFLTMAAGGRAGQEPPRERAAPSMLAGRARGYLLGIGEGEPVERTLERLREIFP